VSKGRVLTALGVKKENRGEREKQETQGVQNGGNSDFLFKTSILFLHGLRHFMTLSPYKIGRELKGPLV
jgi:hypothetical protein